MLRHLRDANTKGNEVLDPHPPEANCLYLALTGFILF
jgi:hypothetical protein